MSEAGVRRLFRLEIIHFKICAGNQSEINKMYVRAHTGTRSPPPNNLIFDGFSGPAFTKIYALALNCFLCERERVGADALVGMK